MASVLPNECIILKGELARLQQLVDNRAVQVSAGIDEVHQHPGVDTAEFWWLALISLGLICLGGLASGLTVGLVGIDKTQLQLKLQGPDATEQSRAAQVLRLTENRHRLLITLLLANTFANECLPIALDRLVPAYVAIALSIFGVLVFGEILPMSVLTGPRQLELVAKTAGVVEAMMSVTSCVVVPIAQLLDYLVGDNHARHFSRQELQSLLRMNAESPQHRRHRNECSAAAEDGVLPTCDESEGSPVTHEEVCLAVSALGFSTKSAASCMRGLNEVFMLDAAAPFDSVLLQQVREEGYSRLPVFAGQRGHIVGVLLAKALVGLEPQPELTLKQWAAARGSRSPSASPSSERSPEDAERRAAPVRAGADEAAGNTSRTASQLRASTSALLRPLVVPPELALPALVQQFRTHEGGCQLALVAHGSKVLGIVTIKDALEELMQSQLEDEFDKARRSSCESAEASRWWSTSPTAAASVLGRQSGDPPSSVLGRQSGDHPAQAETPFGMGGSANDGADAEQAVPLSNSYYRRPWDGDTTPGNALQ